MFSSAENPGRQSWNFILIGTLCAKTHNHTIMGKMVVGRLSKASECSDTGQVHI